MAHMIGLMRLGRDAELRYTPSGDAVANLSLAYNHGKKEADGRRPSQWIDATIWGKRAESLAQYLKKGTAVDVILSDVHVEEYESKGTTKSKLVARVLEIEFAGGERREESERQDSPPAPEKTAAPARNSQGASRGFDDMDDDSIPFRDPLAGPIWRVA